MQDTDWNELLVRLKRRYADLSESKSRRESFLAHVQNLAHWEIPPGIHVDPTMNFPGNLDIALAVCHPDCGTEEFIVEGSTQECQRCGRLLFRVHTCNYTRTIS